MRIGIGLPNQIRGVDAAILPGWAAQAEKAGFASLATIGRIAYPGVMDTIALAVAAASTTTIGLISAIAVGPAYPAVLLAKEAANIDAVSGGRLTLGLGLGAWPDDDVAEGRPRKNIGPRLEDDIRVYREVWGGAAIGGGAYAAVAVNTRDLPVLLGGAVEASYERVARLADGYIGGAVPASMVSPSFDAVRARWKDAGRTCAPRLVALAYYAFDDIDAGRANIQDYYSSAGEQFAGLMTGNISHGAGGVRATMKAFEEIGADELIFSPAVSDPAEIDRLAEVVL
jgi:alkanesulfonate monooxygenase SsuD/methylene tetrahydromethanopterin reductase-like flavin-dependent oxidoreductase (luciferase family)